MSHGTLFVQNASCFSITAHHCANEEVSQSTSKSCVIRYAKLLSVGSGVQVPFATPANNAESLCFQGFSAFLISKQKKRKSKDRNRKPPLFRDRENRTSARKRKISLIISRKTAVFANENGLPANLPKNLLKILLIRKGGCFQYHAVMRNKIEY